MALTTQEKEQQLLALARKRQGARLAGYACLADFHGGIFEGDYISPWSKSAHNVDTSVMVIGQDWASAEMLKKTAPDSPRAKLGFDPEFPTNVKLDQLLWQHLGLRRADCYLTNLFVLIKLGSASASIPSADLNWSAKTFTIPEIEIVSPKLVICLGLRTFRALMRAAGQSPARTIETAIASPMSLGTSTVRCVAHTGALGTLNRSREKVERDWEALGRALRESTAPREGSRAR
jgi:hypothetical protein